ncbi:MAG: hypothetical protein COV79_00010 [Parcubacteria group bacterium CG11_big_fil_rev_8_21_14_0_20_41_14]|nr:MAG: hypothetical protein COV79_00010 [Parcubacteria group bacterium CG11_big_fil_rev_8_21_14_0_20_41_14]
MEDNLHNDINLLPHDLRKKRKKISRVQEKPDYTSIKNGSKSKEKKSFFSRIFSIFTKANSNASPSSQARLPEKKDDIKIKKPVIHDLPQGKPLPSALFSKIQSKPPAESTIPAQKKETETSAIEALDVMSMHSPNFLSRKKEDKAPEAIAPLSITPTPRKEQEKAQPKKPEKHELSPIEPKPDTNAFKVSKLEEKNNQTSAPIHRVNTFDVNLLTQEYSQTFRKTRPIFTLVASLASCAALIAFIYAGISAYSASARNRIEKTQAISSALKETIATYKSLDDEDSILRKKLDIVSILLLKHISWYSFLGKLEQETIPEVAYMSMSASSEGAMSITALAKDYTSLARQMTVFQNTKWIERIDVTAASLIEDTATIPGGVSFDMQVFINKNILYSSR